MTIDTLRRRLIFQLTTPPALFYTLTRHWLIVGLFFAGACAWILINAALAPPVYEGKATLQMRLQGTNVVSQNDTTARPRTLTPREDDERFFQQVELLKGDSVLRKLASELRTQLALEPDRDMDEKPNQGAIRQMLGKVRKTVRATLKTFEEEIPEEQGEAYLMETAIEAFRNGSLVVPHPETSTVELKVYGPNRELIKLQLERWIDAYKARLEELAKDTEENYLLPQVKRWAEKETTALKNLDDFKAEHPEVTKPNLDLLFSEVLGFQAMRTELRRPPLPTQPLRQQPLGTGITLPTVPEDPLLQSMIARHATLEEQYQAALRLHPPGSDVVTRIQADLERLGTQIGEKQVAVNLRRAQEMEAAEKRWKDIVEADKAAVEQDLASRKKLEDDRVKSEKDLTASIAAHMRRYTVLSQGLEKLKVLEDTYEQARLTRRRYDNMLMEEQDRLQSQRNLEVQERDPPEVSLTPYKTSQRKDIALGLAGGLGLGIAIALALEVFRNKVRFKSDVLNELSLPVVGVFPRR